MFMPKEKFIFVATRDTAKAVIDDLNMLHVIHRCRSGSNGNYLITVWLSKYEFKHFIADVYKEGIEFYENDYVSKLW